MVPKRSKASAQAATAPGTETEPAPLLGISPEKFSLKNSGVASAPDRPLPFRAATSPVAPS